MTDIQVDDNYDILIADGDLSVGVSDDQHQAMLLYAHQGEFKQYPTLGVGLDDILNDHDFNAWRSEITSQFESDGMRINSLKLDAGGLMIDATY